MTEPMTNIEDSAVIWSDQASTVSNINGREKFAEAVGSRIDQCQAGQPSTVFGLVGPWGSGKTTLITEITDQLHSWTIVNFSPWSVSSTSALTSEFVAALSAAFPQAQSLQDRLKSYARYGAPALALIPVVGEAAASMADKAVAEVTNRPSWYLEFDKISKDIAKQDIRVLVVVDDVDRLDGEELRALFRVVRLLGRFTNVHYLLAYDQSTIDELLSAVGSGGHSSDFMEKIVQYPFEVPPAPKVVRRRWSREIVELFTPNERDGAEESAYAEQRDELISILTSGLGTPRAANRLREQVSSLMGLIQHAEIDALDFLALTWLRISHHRLWDHIRLHQDFYLGWRENDEADVRSERDKVVAAQLDRGVPTTALSAVHFLFDSVEVQDAFAQRRWCIKNARFFDRYFLIGVPEDDVSELMIERGLHALELNAEDNIDANELRLILEGPDQDRAVLAVQSVHIFRRKRYTTTTGLIDFIDLTISNVDKASSSSNDLKRALELWLNSEIFLALSRHIITDSELISRYGYNKLTHSAYSARREAGGDGHHVRDAYKSIALAWLTDFDKEPLAIVLERPELLAVTSFLIWLEKSDNHRGFLSKHITDSETLLAIATRFVGFNEWIGSDINYEVVFREQEFRFAAGDTLTPEIIENLPLRSSLPDYAVDDLPTRDLNATQRRDFALRSLQSLVT